MKVLFISPQPFFEERGTPIAVLELIRVLGSLGHKVDLYTYPIGRDIEVDGLNIIRSPGGLFFKDVQPGPSYRKGILDVFLFLKTLLALFGKRYDVIHAVEEAAFFSVILKKIFRIPLIYDMDSSIPSQIYYTGFIKNSLVQRFATSLERWAIKNSSLVITVCRSLTDIVKKEFPEKPVYQIEDLPLVFEEDMVSNEVLEKVKKDLDIDGSVVIVYTGNFEGYQGLELLINAIPHVVKKVEDVKFLLVGGEERQVNELKRKSENIGIREKVVFTGKRPLEEMPLYMGVSDMLVSPRIEGTNTPLKIYTYLKSGKPIVATNLLTHTQVLNRDIAVLTEPEPESLAEGIILLVKDRRFREEMGKKGAAYVDSISDRKRFYDKVSDVYNFIEKMKR
jgi:glycosyltransferase involved in cell wall biosynthesis